MKNKELKISLFKSLTAFLVFEILYSFVFAVIAGDLDLLKFLLNYNLVHVYAILNILIAAIAYIGAGYIIMIARNKYEDLRKKNLHAAIAIFIINLLILLLLVGLQLIFVHREIYKYFILFNYPTLRYILFLDEGLNKLWIGMFLVVVIKPIFVYYGGLIRIRELKRGGLIE